MSVVLRLASLALLLLALIGVEKWAQHRGLEVCPRPPIDSQALSPELFLAIQRRFSRGESLPYEAARAWQSTREGECVGKPSDDALNAVAAWYSQHRTPEQTAADWFRYSRFGGILGGHEAAGRYFLQPASPINAAQATVLAEIGGIDGKGDVRCMGSRVRKILEERTSDPTVIASLRACACGPTQWPASTSRPASAALVSSSSRRPHP